jgi:hypothetical protein
MFTDMRALLKLLLFLLFVLALLAIAPAAAQDRRTEPSLEAASALPPPPTNTPPHDRSFRWRETPEKPRHWRRHLVARAEKR